MRDSFVFYRSFKKAIQKIKRKEDKLALYEAITDYALDGTEPDEDASELITVLMETIKPQVDANNKRFENGNKGGRPPKDKSKKPVVSDLKTIGYESENHRFSDSKPNVNVNDNVNVNEDGDDNGSGSLPNADDSLSLSERIISYLNEKTGSHYRPASAEAKLQGLLDQGYTEADMRMVIDRKCADWLDDDKMREHLRPSTLFRVDKFEEYLNAPVSLKMEKEQKRTDTKASLEKQLEEKTEALAVISDSIESMKDQDGRVSNNITEYRALKEQAAILEDTIGQIKSRLRIN